MVKQAMLLTAVLLIMGTTKGQVVVQINAGSRAPWGTNQNLFINQQGHCQYYVNEVNGAIKETNSFAITSSQLDSIMAKAQQVGFFSLNAKYDGGLADGSGIFISINSAGKINSVNLLNRDIPPIHDLVETLNTILAQHGVRITYGH